MLICELNQIIKIIHHKQELYCTITQDSQFKRLVCHFSNQEKDFYALVAAVEHQPENLIHRIVSFAKAYIRIHNVEQLESELKRCFYSHNTNINITI